MPREKEGFRDQLERLTEKFPGRECLTIEEASKLLQVHRQTLLQDKDFPAQKVGAARASRGGKYIVPLVGLARWLS